MVTSTRPTLEDRQALLDLVFEYMGDSKGVNRREDANMRWRSIGIIHFLTDPNSRNQFSSAATMKVDELELAQVRNIMTATVKVCEQAGLDYVIPERLELLQKNVDELQKQIDEFDRQWGLEPRSVI